MKWNEMKWNALIEPHQSIRLSVAQFNSRQYIPALFSPIFCCLVFFSFGLTLTQNNQGPPILSECLSPGPLLQFALPLRVRFREVWWWHAPASSPSRSAISTSREWWQTPSTRNLWTTMPHTYLRDWDSFFSSTFGWLLPFLWILFSFHFALPSGR